MSLIMSMIQQSHDVQRANSEDCMTGVENYRMEAVSSPVKRPLPDASEQAPDARLTASESAREASPAPSTVSSLTSLSDTPAPGDNQGSSNPQPPPAKRRKLTPTEKTALDRVKAEKRAKREQEKAGREAEKQKKDEERRQKNEVLEEKKREKELKKQVREEAKRQDDEEKARKERAQSRINAFFAKPKSSPRVDDSPRLPHRPTPDGTRLDDTESKTAPGTPSKPPNRVSDYDRTFLPFAAPSNSIIARPNYFTWDEESTFRALQDADTWFTPKESATMSTDLSQCLDLAPFETSECGWTSTPVSELVRRIDGSTQQAIDLADDGRVQPPNARQRLKEYPMKYIFFHQDVRPPYIGTLSKLKSRAEAVRLGRRPTKQIRQEIDYDEDSEAEWEEPEEGEELGSEGEDDDESMADAEELEEFLDDEGADDAQRPKKRFLSGDMQPVSTGLCWENDAQKILMSKQSLLVNPSDYRMEILSDTFDFPIDPFSVTYWPSAHTASDPVAAIAADPNRPPLIPRPNIHLNGVPPPVTADAFKQQKPQKPPKQLRLLSGQELEDFKSVVSGSDLTKQGLLAVVKKKLPKVPNAVLSDTLSTIAARVGVKEVDKRWVIVSTPS